MQIQIHILHVKISINIILPFFFDLWCIYMDWRFLIYFTFISMAMGFLQKTTQLRIYSLPFMCVYVLIYDCNFFFLFMKCDDDVSDNSNMKIIIIISIYFSADVVWTILCDETQSFMEWWQERNHSISQPKLSPITVWGMNFNNYFWISRDYSNSTSRIF